MIKVAYKTEPVCFNKLVRQPGLAWAKKNGIDLTKPLPPKTTLKDYWTADIFKEEMHVCYNNICAYLGIRLENATGGSTVDHYFPKKKYPCLAYEWINYRLADSNVNSRKGDYEDVLDPFFVESDWFRMDFFIGHIYPNPSLSKKLMTNIQNTIDRLKLDNEALRKRRIRYYDEYINRDISASKFRRDAPFVWFEADRQGLL